MVRTGATRALARGVTDLAIGSSDWLGSGLNAFFIPKTATTRAVTRFVRVPIFASTINFLAGGARHLWEQQALLVERF